MGGRGKNNYKHSLCWDCKRAVEQSCSWAANFEPVKGWKVQKGNVSVRVIKCPEFIRDAEDFGMKRLDDGKATIAKGTDR